jgi:hypothetical protein
MADPEVRLYGAADSTNRQNAAENGMRGEGASDAAGSTYRRDVALAGQPAIVVEETSGVAFAEAARADPPMVRTTSGSMLPWLLVALVLGYGAGQLRRRQPKVAVTPPVRTATRPETVVPAALTRIPGEPGGFSQVRDAGQEQIRDPEDRWSAIDEASDESFPASDPPSNSMPGRW